MTSTLRVKVVTGKNFFAFTEPGSMGVVTDKPTCLFAKGSSGIEVQPPDPALAIEEKLTEMTRASHVEMMQ